MYDPNQVLAALTSLYPRLKFSLNADGKVVCNIGLTTFGVLNDDGTPNIEAINSCVRIDKFLEVEQGMIDRGLYGQYAIIIPDGKVMVCPTEHSALTYAEQFQGRAFVGRIGMELKRTAELMSGLAREEFPIDHETLENETEYPLETIFTYYGSNRSKITQATNYPAS